MTTTHLGDLAERLRDAMNNGRSTERIVLAIADALPSPEDIDFANFDIRVEAVPDYQEVP